MAYSCPHDLDGFMPHLTKVDIKFRQQVGSDLLTFLEDFDNEITCQDIGQFIDNLVPWMQNSNYKVSRNGIEIMTQLVDRLGTDFRPYVPAVLPCVVDRLGDGRDAVRDSAQLLLRKLVERDVLSAQTLLDKLTPAFGHKNAKVREEVLRCLVTILNEYGAQAIALSKVIPHVVKLVSDPAGPVRDAALSAIVDAYKHVGERLRQDIQRRNLVPAAKLPVLLARLDEVLESGELLPTAKICADMAPLPSDEVDRITMVKPAIPLKRAGLALTVKKAPSKVTRTPSGATSGAVDEETFVRSFEDVPAIQIFSPRELVEHMKTIQETIGDQNKEWNKRIDALKKIRSLVVAGAINYSDFYTSLRNMDLALQASVRDLRSQVVREAAITIAYLAQSIGSKFDKTAELVLPHLINLIQNSVKIMATAGIVTIKFIIQYTQSPRLLPILTSCATASKSKDIRRACCECLDLLLNAWPTSALERHIALLQDAVKKGIADADAEARISSRKAYKGFRDHFPDQAEALLQSLEAGYRKALQGELSSSSSSGSLAQTAAGIRNAVVHAPAAPASRQFYAPRQVPSSTTAPGSTTGSTENLSITAGCLQRTPSLPRSSRQRSGIPVLSSTTKKGFRSNSAIDLQAAQRARARAQYSVLARQKVSATSTATLPGDEDIALQARPRKIESSTAMQSPERLSRTKSRGSGVSHSQPTSRSNSPSSKHTPYSTLGYYHHHRPHASALTDTSLDTPSPPIGRRRLSSGIPRSTQGSRDTSRETSPNRSLGGVGGSGGRVRRSIDNRPPISPITKQPIMTQRILQQSREAESALADALIYDQLDSSLVYQGRVGSPRKGMRSLEHNSDDSETSSVCSERSYDSYRRASESYSWSGSQQRLASKDLWEPCKDINEIIALCTSTTWQERKEGLVSLRLYLSAGKNLSAAELKYITDLFTRMFMDAHTKGLCVFLDTLNEIIRRYKADLVDWLYILLQRIFNKVGSDVLSSTIAKLVSTLDLVRISFPVPAQLTSIFRYVGDPAQTPSVKTKTAVLNYLSSLCAGAAREPAPVGFGTTNSNKHMQQAIGKIITWANSTGATGSAELRQAAKTSIVALWNLNTPAMTLLLSELSKEQQDIASNIVYSHMRKSSTGSEPGSPLGATGSSPPSLVGSKPLSPVMPQPRLLLGPGGDDPANSQEEIYKSLRRTTAEIQNYSYEALGGKLDRDRDTTSQDSGISQMSADNNNHHRHDVAAIEERMEELHVRSNYAGVSNAAGSSGPRSLQYTVNGMFSEADSYSSNGYNNLNDLNEDELVQKILVQCSAIDNPTPEAEKRKLLIQLTKIFERGEVEPVIQNFKKVLRILVDNLNVKDSETRVTVLQILTEMLKTPAMKACWSNFIELLIVRVFNAYCDESRLVVKTAETTAAAMSAFPFNTVLNTLSPLVRTGPPVAIQGAIRMLTKLIEMNSQSVTDEHLQALMPGLISANEHEESSVRKAVVFCMVALHTAVGEPRFAPYIECLPGSKLKLLKLYLGRAQQATLNTSMPTSPRNTGGANGGGSGSGNSNSAASGGS